MKRTPLKRVSSKRSKELREYAKLRKAFLEAHPYCQVWIQEAIINGTSRNNPPLSTDIHHVRGRWGKRLNDITNWLAVCRESHHRIHSNPAWAYERGYLTKR